MVPLVAAQAWFQLGAIAAGRARFADALELTDRGIARVAKAMPGADIFLLPSLISQRGWILAVLDRREDALDELAMLAKAHPTYPWRAASQLVTHMLLAVRNGELDAASDLAALSSSRTCS